MTTENDEQTKGTARTAIVGTFGPDTPHEIYAISTNPKSGTTKLLGTESPGPNPSYVTTHPEYDIVYIAVREPDEGAIVAYEVNKLDGSLTKLNATPTGSVSPCYCAVDSTGRYLLVAHYTGGAVSMLPIDADGTTRNPVAVIDHDGSGPDPDRQSAPHPHSVVPGPENRFVYAPDLGADQIVVYDLDTEEGTLSEHATVDTPPGSGPRHITFGPNGERAYLIRELDSTITMYDRLDSGNLRAMSSVSTLPPEFSGESKSAEIAVHPNGRYVYGSNRGHDSIVTVEITNDSLDPISYTSTGGEWPRDFTVGPDGSYLYAENRDTGGIVTLEIDCETGDLSPTGDRLSLTDPVCMKWV